MIGEKRYEPVLFDKAQHTFLVPDYRAAYFFLFSLDRHDNAKLMICINPESR